MPYPTVREADFYKAPNVTSEVRVAIELDYPVATGFSDTFPGAALDATKWYSTVPSWATVTVAGSTVRLAVTGSAISPAWLQSRHNLTFPIRRDSDWVFECRIRFPNVTGFGVGIALAGRSTRDMLAVWTVWSDLADGLVVRAPDGYAGTMHWVWNTVVTNAWMRHRVTYDWRAQTYLVEVDTNDDGVFEVAESIPVAGRYADSIVIGNSIAVQGHLGTWTQIEVDSVSVTVTTPDVVYVPDWANPFYHVDLNAESHRYSWLPTMVSGRISCSKDNLVDAADVTLEVVGPWPASRSRPSLYADMRFLGRHAFIEGRVGDGRRWLPWVRLFNGVCAEKQVQLGEGGQATVSVPMRDVWRAAADDVEVLQCYSDAAAVIVGVEMHLTVAQIIAHIFGTKCGLPALAYSIMATPNNVPRTYNVFRQSGMQAVQTIAEHAALAVYIRPSDGRITVGDWPWGTDAPGYVLSSRDEVRSVEWTESAFDAYSAEVVTYENTEYPDSAYTLTWPRDRLPFYGRAENVNSVACQSSTAHYQRPISPLSWWARNRKLGSVLVTAPAQFWVEHDLELAVVDDSFIGIGLDTHLLVDGWEHTWTGEGPAMTQLRLIDTHPDLVIRRGLPR